MENEDKDQELTQDQVMEMMEKNVEFLRSVIAPDDIYIFAELNFMTALFFMKTWSLLVDVDEECKKDPITNKYVINMLNFLVARDQETPPSRINFGMFNDPIFKDKEKD